MHSQDRAVLVRATLYSFLAGVAAGIVYLVIAHFYAGMRFDGATFTRGLITGAISFVIALAFFSGFMLYFSRKYARKQA